MARIIYPGTAAGWKKLHDSIKAKHTADGNASPLKIFLTEQQIDIGADNTALGDAVTEHDLFISAEGKAEEYLATRNNLFKPAFKRMRNAVQFLKKLYVKNPNKLTDWGQKIDNDNRVVYPAPYAERYKVWVKFYAKHTSYPGNQSPLNGYLSENDVDLPALNVKAGESFWNNDKFNEKSMEKEEKKKTRDNLMEKPVKNTKGMCQYLLKYFSGNPKKLGQYGITVDDSPRGSIRRKANINPGEEKLVNGALIGGQFINAGATILELRAGKKGGGEKRTIEQGKEFTLTKGYSAFIVRNMSNESKGTYLVDINR